MKINNSQRFMKFDKSVETARVKSEHRFEYNFSKEFIKNKSLLNVGSWTGPYEILASKSTKKITAIDIDERPLKILKSNLPHVRTVKASAHDLPFRNNSFDVVTFWAVIEHLPIGYELATLKEINRVLKPGGTLFLTTMSKNLLSNLLDPACYTVGHRHYADSQLNNMLSDAGFKIEKLIVNGSFISAFHAWAFYFFKYFFRQDLPSINYIEDKFEKDYNSSGFYYVAVRAIKNEKKKK